MVSKWSLLYMFWLTAQVFTFIAFFILGWEWLTFGIASTFLMTVLEFRELNRGIETLFTIEQRREERQIQKFKYKTVDQLIRERCKRKTKFL